MGTTSKKTTRPAASAPRRARRDSARPAETTPATEEAAQTAAPAMPQAMNVAMDVAGTTTVSSDPSADDIKALAYRYFVESGFAHGNALDHWLRAETALSGHK